MEMKACTLAQYITVRPSGCLAGWLATLSLICIAFCIVLLSTAGNIYGWACDEKRLFGFLSWKKEAKKSWHIITTTGGDNGRRSLCILCDRTRGFCTTRTLIKITNWMQYLFNVAKIAVIWYGSFQFGPVFRIYRGITLSDNSHHYFVRTFRVTPGSASVRRRSILS